MPDIPVLNSGNNGGDQIAFTTNDPVSGSGDIQFRTTIILAEGNKQTNAAPYKVTFDWLDSYFTAAFITNCTLPIDFNFSPPTPYADISSNLNLSLIIAMNSPFVGLSSLVATRHPNALFSVCCGHIIAHFCLRYN